MKRSLLLLALLWNACSRSHGDVSGAADLDDGEHHAPLDAALAPREAALTPLEEASAAAADASRVPNAVQDASGADGEAATSLPTEAPSTGQLQPIERQGEYLRLLEVPAENLEAFFSAGSACGPISQDAQTRLRVNITHGPCDTLGPVSADVSDPSAPKVSAWLWRAEPSCAKPDGIARSQRDLLVTLSRAAPGSYPISTSSDAVAMLTVASKADTCPVAMGKVTCAHDCECDPGLACSFEWGPDFVCGGWCRARCENAAGCSGTAPGASCGSAERACPSGMACRDGRCRWDTELSADARHACTRHADCAEGLLCVQSASAKRTCEVPCNDPSMRCPGMHLCQRQATHTGAEWVCE